ncbi:hypothetical protein [Rubinisphaera margarita]|uniref:hypothetical protein n=1 Tax=Rubinisphaera margarita TaxID=2909586 RepID=UPI001EE7A00F|nr:hypothetical protein [Rubinisphaera margarita]MCG6156521.1 hypothetical protein [Rubinisphaera margarita]
MKQTRFVTLVGCTAAALFFSAFISPSLRGESDESKPKSNKAETKRPVADAPGDQLLQHFMREKLKASTDILEGLTTEDFRLIGNGASRLYKMSTVEKWNYSNDAMYRQFSSEFQRVTHDLIKASDDRSLDRSALKWIDVTMKCIECHRYVRDTLIVED